MCISPWGGALPSRGGSCPTPIRTSPSIPIAIGTNQECSYDSRCSPPPRRVEGIRTYTRKRMGERCASNSRGNDSIAVEIAAGVEYCQVCILTCVRTPSCPAVYNPRIWRNFLAGRRSPSTHIHEPPFRVEIILVEHTGLAGKGTEEVCCVLWRAVQLLLRSFHYSTHLRQRMSRGRGHGRK